MQGIVVTATDTDAGKSVVSAAIVAAARERGIAAGYLKPFASGCEPDASGRLVSPDARFVAEVCGLGQDPAELSVVSLQAPLAPLMAAREEGVEIDWQEVLGRTRELAGQWEVCVVEGVGGVMVPVAEGKLFVEFVAELGLPVVVVARTGLGTINHTLLTLEALRARGVKVGGVVMCQCSQQQPDPSARTNPAVIEEFGEVKVLGVVGFVPEVAGGGVGAGRALAREGGGLRLEGLVPGW